MTSDVAGLVLAAGSGSRFGGPKALVEGPLTTAGQSLWQDGYATFQSGA